MSGGGSLGRKLIEGPTKLWLYPTIGLCIVGSVQLAASWSEVFTQGVGAGVGIAVEDAPNLGSAFKEGQQAAGGSGGGGGGSPQVAQPADSNDNGVIDQDEADAVVGQASD